MQIECAVNCGVCQLRPLASSDLATLAMHANNPRVAAHLRDRFPFPYRLADARQFLDYADACEDECVAAIVVQSAAVGIIGVQFHTDIERCSAELGYWLGEAMWGRGLATAAVRQFTAWAMPRFALTRVYAEVFAENPASGRVLEKCGFQRIGLLRKAAIKAGYHHDYVLYDLVL